MAFIDQCAELSDSRFGDPSYLAAKYVVYLSNMFSEAPGSMDFLSVGVCAEDPGDIEYRYVVECVEGGYFDKEKPTVKCFKIYGRGYNVPQGKWTLREVNIPPAEEEVTQ